VAPAAHAAIYFPLKISGKMAGRGIAIGVDRGERFDAAPEITGQGLFALALSAALLEARHPIFDRRLKLHA
jgi:hypothetical protein